MTHLVHRDEPTWFDPDTGDVTYALRHDSMTPEETTQLEETGMFDPRHLVRIPQDDRDGATYDPEIVTRVLEAAEGPFEGVDINQYRKLLKQRRNLP